MKEFMKVLGNIGFCVFLILVIILAYMGETGSIGGYTLFSIMTGSMEPTFSVGTLVVGETVDPKNIREGNIITYKGVTGSTVTTHRVQEVRQGEEGIEFVTKGDANSVVDPVTVKGSNVISRVFVDLKHVGGIITFLQENMGAVIGVGLLIYFYIWFISRKKSRVNIN